MTTLPTTYITFEQYLADASLPESSEWEDGKVIIRHAVAEPHDRITRWLNELLGPYVKHRKLGRLMGEPFCMHLSVNVGRSPDLFFVANEHLDRIQPKHLEGPADLAIEVISPESRSRDIVQKLDEYDRGGVGEYWVIDPVAGTAVFYRRGAEGRYAEVGPEDGIYRTPTWPEVAFDVAWLKMNPLPDPFEVWAEWGIR